MKITVVSPHRDDAAFSLGLSIEHWLATGHTVRVLNCFTQSAYAPYSDVELVHENDKLSFVSALRKREDATWNKMLGGKLQFTDLDLIDAPVRLNLQLGEIFSVAIRPGDRALARVTGAVSKAMGREAQGNAAVIAPLSLGGHIDHRICTQAAMDAAGASGVPLAFYEDLPYVARVDGQEIEAAAAATGLALEPGFAEPEPGDGAVRVARKRRVAEAYDSQIDSEVAEEIARFSQRYGARERIWMTQSWRESELGGEQGSR